MSKFYDVLVAGDYTLDLIFSGLPGLPQAGEDVKAGSFTMTPGGASYISTAAMHRLGLRVGWAADFGNDDFSRFILQQAEQEGLDESLFIHHARPLRHVSAIASLKEDRAIFTYYDPDPQIPAIMKALTRAQARLLLIPGLYYGPFLDLGLRLARARRLKIAMDGNLLEPQTLRNTGVRRAISGVDLFIPNAREARLLTEKDELPEAIQVLGKLCPLVVVKNGGDGAYAYQAGQMHHSPALIINTLDTTGAGDCFNAGFIKAWLDGRALKECLRWGNIVGGLSTQAAGGTGRVVTVEDVLQRV
jgi:sugar/nucleoside kinase (ribokinase family)